MPQASKHIFIACDHAGLPLKKILMEKFPNLPWVDMGTNTEASVDYPDYAEKLAHKLFEDHVDAETAQDIFHTTMGVLICGSGQGMAIKANRYPHIRAALCWTPEIAELSRKHNNANVLCMGSRTTDHTLALQIFEKFLTTPFEGGRHGSRVAKLC
jgi:ribose 5-phosphate isomerase B